jgi:hypothetical protein
MQHVVVKVVKQDLEGFGAWCAESLKENDGTILLNLEACLGELVNEDGTQAPGCNRARLVVETLMHEFGHSVEEALGLNHDEDFIEESASKFFK